RPPKPRSPRRWRGAAPAAPKAPPNAARPLRPTRAADEAVEARASVGIQSLGRAFGILEEVARHRDGIGLADLSRLVGLHNSTTFHLAKIMAALGYVRQEKDTKRYLIGRPLFALAGSALEETEMTKVATPILEALARQTGGNSHFAVP